MLAIKTLTRMLAIKTLVRREETFKGSRGKGLMSETSDSKPLTRSELFLCAVDVNSHLSKMVTTPFWSRLQKEPMERQQPYHHKVKKGQQSTTPSC